MLASAFFALFAVLCCFLSLANAELRSKDWDGQDIPGTRTKTRQVAR